MSHQFNIFDIMSHNRQPHNLRSDENSTKTPWQSKPLNTAGTKPTAFGLTLVNLER